MRKQNTVKKHNDVIESAVLSILLLSNRDLSQVTVYSVADSLGVSRGHLISLFKEYHDQSIHSIIEKEKMRRARRILESNTDITLFDVSEELGIGKVDHLISKFKKHHLVTPGKYKKIFHGKEN